MEQNNVSEAQSDPIKGGNLTAIYNKMASRNEQFGKSISEEDFIEYARSSVENRGKIYDKLVSDDFFGGDFSKSVAREDFESYAMGSVESRRADTPANPTAPTVDTAPVEKLGVSAFERSLQNTAKVTSDGGSYSSGLSNQTVTGKEMGWGEWAATQFELGQLQGRRANYFETIGDLALRDISNMSDEDLRKIADYNKQIKTLGKKLEASSSEMGTWARFGEDALGSLISSPTSAVTEVLQDEDALLSIGTAAAGGATGGLPGAITGALYGAGVSMSLGGANVESAQIISDRVDKYAQENGLDTENWEDLKKIYADEDFRKEAEKDAVVGAGVVIAADVVSAGIASKVGAGRFAMDTGRKLAKDRATTFAIETTGEGVGEGVKQVAIGDDLSLRDVALEMTGGAGSTIVQGSAVQAYKGNKPGIVAENQFLTELANNLSPETKEAHKQATRIEFEVEAIVPDTPQGNSPEKTLGYEKSIDNAQKKGIITAQQATSLKENKVKYEQAYQKLPSAIKEDAVKSREATHLLMERDKLDAEIGAISLDEAFASSKTKQVTSLEKKKKAVNDRLRSLGAKESVATMNDYDNTGRAYRAILINTKETNPKGSTPLRSEVEVRGDKLTVNNSEFLESAKDVAKTMGLKMDSPKPLKFDDINTAPIDGLDITLPEQEVSFGKSTATISVDGDVVTVDGDISAENYVRISENFPGKRVVIPFDQNVGRIQRLEQQGLVRKVEDGYEVVDFGEAQAKAEADFERNAKKILERTEIENTRTAVLEDDVFAAEVENANRVLVDSGYTIDVIDDENTYNKLVGGKNKGTGAIVKKGEKRIIVNRNKASATTLRHEAAHALVGGKLKESFGGTNKDADSKMMEFFASMQQILGDPTASPRYNAMLDSLNDFANQYRDADDTNKPLVAQEFLVELSALLSVNQERLIRQPNVVQKIVDAINDLYEALIRSGVRPLNTNSLNEAIDFINGFADTLDANVTEANNSYEQAIRDAQQAKIDQDQATLDAKTKVLNDAYQEVKEDQTVNANKNLLGTNSAVKEVSGDIFDGVVGNRESSGDAYNVARSRKGVDVGIYVHDTKASPLSIPREVGKILIDRGLPAKNRKKIKAIWAGVIRNYLAKADPSMHEAAIAGEENFVRQEDKDNHYLATVSAYMATAGRNLMVPDDFNMDTVEQANDVIEDMFGYRPLKDGKFIMQMLYTMNGIAIKHNKPNQNENYWNYPVWEEINTEQKTETTVDVDSEVVNDVAGLLPRFTNNIGTPGEQMNMFDAAPETKDSPKKRGKKSVPAKVGNKKVVVPTKDADLFAEAMKAKTDSVVKTGPLPTQDYPNPTSKKINKKLSPKKKDNILTRGDTVMYDGVPHRVTTVRGDRVSTRELDAEGNVLPFGVETTVDDKSFGEVLSQKGSQYDAEAELAKLRRASGLSDASINKIENKVFGKSTHITPPKSGAPNNSYAAAMSAKGYAANEYVTPTGDKLDFITLNEYATRITGEEDSLRPSERKSYAYQTGDAISKGYFNPDNVNGLGENTMQLIQDINNGVTGIDSTKAMGLTQVIYALRARRTALENQLSSATRFSEQESISQEIQQVSITQLAALDALKRTTSEGARILNLASQFVPSAAELRTRKSKYLRGVKKYVSDAQYRELEAQYDDFITKYDEVKQQGDQNAKANNENVIASAKRALDEIKNSPKTFVGAVRRLRDFLTSVNEKGIFKQIQQNPQADKDAEFYQNLYEVAVTKIKEDNLSDIDDVVSAVMAEIPRNSNRDVQNSDVLIAMGLGLESNKMDRATRMKTARKTLENFGRVAGDLNTLIAGIESMRGNWSQSGVDFEQFVATLEEMITAMSAGTMGVPTDIASNNNALLVLSEIIGEYDRGIFTESGNVDVATVKAVGERVRAALRLMDLVNEQGDISTDIWAARLDEKIKQNENGVITDAILGNKSGNFQGISEEQARSQMLLKIEEGKLNALKSKVATTIEYKDQPALRRMMAVKHGIVGMMELTRGIGFSFDASYMGYQAFLSTVVMAPGVALRSAYLGVTNPPKAKKYFNAYANMWRNMGLSIGESAKDAALGTANGSRVKEIYLDQVSSNVGREMLSLISDSLTSPLASSKLSQQEEIFANSVFGQMIEKSSKSDNIVGKIFRPLTRPFLFSGDSYTLYMNAVRMGQFEMYLAAHPNSTADQRKRFLTHQMDLTGRATMEGSGAVGKFLTGQEAQAAIGAPRLLVSRINLMTRLFKEIGQVLTKKDYTLADFEITAQFMKVAVGYLALHALMESLTDFELEEDVNDSAFLKYKRGDEVLDIGAGMTQFIKIPAFAMFGDVDEMKASQNANRTPFDDIKKLALYKLHPQWNAAATLYSGENVIGQGLGATNGEKYWNTFASSFVPIMAQDILKSNKSVQKTGTPWYATVLSMAGFNNYRYDNMLKNVEVVDYLDTIEWENSDGEQKVGYKPMVSSQYLDKWLRSEDDPDNRPYANIKGSTKHNPLKKTISQRFSNHVEDVTGVWLADQLDLGITPGKEEILEKIKENAEILGPDYWELLIKNNTSLVFEKIDE